MEGRRFELAAEVTDEGGRAVWPRPDMAVIRVDVESVNTYKPEWFPPPPPDQTVQVEEHDPDVVGMILLKVNARDRDHGGENKRVSYFLKVNGENVASDGQFSLDEDTGELKALGKITYYIVYCTVIWFKLYTYILYVHTYIQYTYIV